MTTVSITCARLIFPFVAADVAWPSAPARVPRVRLGRDGWSEGEWVRDCVGGHDIGGIRHRIEMRYFGDRFDGGVESIERYRQQRLWSLEKREERREGNSLFLNLEESEGRDDVKGINRSVFSSGPDSQFFQKLP